MSNSNNLASRFLLAWRKRGLCYLYRWNRLHCIQVDKYTWSYPYCCCSLHHHYNLRCSCHTHWYLRCYKHSLYSAVSPWLLSVCVQQTRHSLPPSSVGVNQLYQLLQFHTSSVCYIYRFTLHPFSSNYNHEHTHNVPFTVPYHFHQIPLWPNSVLHHDICKFLLPNDLKCQSITFLFKSHYTSKNAANYRRRILNG